MSRSLAKSVSKNSSRKYSPKHLGCARKYAIDENNSASNRATQKTAEATGDLIGNKIEYKNTKVSKSSPKII